MISVLLNLFRKKELTLEVTQRITQIWLGHSGKMVSFSKTIYSRDNKKSWVIFNGNVCIKHNGKPIKIWYGDIDITKSYKELRILAREINCTVYVLKEMDGRFEYEENPQIQNAVYTVNPDGKEFIGKPYLEFIDQTSLQRIN